MSDLASRLCRLSIVTTLVCLGTLAQSVLAKDAVTLQLKWHHAFQFAGYYAAVEKGYYRDAGLEVVLREAKPGDDPVRKVLDGEAQYGVGNSSLLLARKAGKPVVVLAAIFQHSPAVFIAAQKTDTQGIQDLAGKRVMIEPQSDELLAYLKREGIALDRIQRVEHSFEPQDLIDGKVDAISAYVTNEPYFLDRAGFAYRAYTPRSVGIDFYGDNLFTTEQEIRKHPQEVRAFREASLRGWRYAMAHPDEIADLIVSRYSQAKPREFYLFEAQRMAELLRTDLIEIGYLNPGRWRHIADTYADIGLLPRDFALDGFLYAVDSRSDRNWLYLVGALLVAISAVTVHTLRTNRRLARTLAEKRVVHQALRESEERHRLLGDNASDVIWTMDLDGHFTYVSPSVEKLRGYTSAEVMKQSLHEALTPESAAIAMEGLGRCIAAIKAGLPVPEFRGELEQPCRDGTSVWTEVTTTDMRNSNGEFIGILGVTRDISERKRMEDQVYRLAFHDPLTNLPNRRLLNDRLGQTMAASKRSGHYGAVMFLDLDNFKPLNDTHGHEVGDLLLVEVAARLQGCVREMDTVARFGGDEFVVMISELQIDRSESIAQARLVAEKIRLALAEPYLLTVKRSDDAATIVEHHCTTSIGLTLFLGREVSQDELLKNADMAMYSAKEAGRNSVQIAPDYLDGAATVDLVTAGFVRLFWHSSYESGNAQIDDRHRSLFADANAVLAAVLGERSNDDISLLIDALVHDITRHFAEEEAIFTRTAFTDAAGHTAIHRQLIDKADVLVERFHAGTLDIGALFQFLAYDMIVQHILGADREFFPYLEKNVHRSDPLFVGTRERARTNDLPGMARMEMRLDEHRDKHQY